MTKLKDETAGKVGVQRFIYLGPNLTKYGLTKYTVFVGGLPETQAKELFEKQPLSKLLFVSTSKIAETETAIKTAGTPQYEVYQNLLKRGE